MFLAQAMSDPKELDEICPGEAKRQREALRRKLEKGGPPPTWDNLFHSMLPRSYSWFEYGWSSGADAGLRPGLVEKFGAAKSSNEKPCPKIRPVRLPNCLRLFSLGLICSSSSSWTPALTLWWSMRSTLSCSLNVLNICLCDTSRPWFDIYIYIQI